LKVEIPKHELEHNEAATEEEDHTQFEVDMVMFNFLRVPWLYCMKPGTKIANDYQILVSPNYWTNLQILNFDWLRY